MLKIALSFVAFLTFIMSIFTPAVSTKNLTDNSDFTPVIRFIAASDSHVRYACDKQCMRVQKAIKTGNMIAADDAEYNKLDAVMFAGDLTDRGRKDQFCGFVSAVNSVKEADTRLLAVMGLSHDNSTLGKTSQQYYTELTGLPAQYHYVINGFHFIGISTSTLENEQYSEYQRTWLKEELAKATADDAQKPIFVTHHEHNLNTVYGSSDFDGWGMDYFTDILAQYPQVVDFSGHSHYPLNDPRSLWQGDYTAVGTGALYYMELTVEGERVVHPQGNHREAQMWVVEVDASNRIRLRGVDLVEEKWLCEYIINNPADKTARQYTPEQRQADSKPPVFADEANIKVNKFAGICRVTFPAASPTDSMPIFLYRAYVYNDKGEEIEMKYLLPKYYSATQDATQTIKLDSTHGTVKVVAETAYGVQSAPITASID